ncbi:MAG TPA: GTPase, partial [Thermoanaerobaculia bacterium]
MTHRFTVVIAGRPNVGKSALFNRLVRRRQSLVHDQPGMTRDVLEGEARLPDGRTYRVLDTGGFDPEGSEAIPKAVRESAAAAIRKADLVLLVTDASAGVLAGDRAAADLARKSGRETIVVPNKIDRKEGSAGEVEAWELGFPEVYGVSAEHAIGIDELNDAIVQRMPAAEPADSPVDSATDEREIALAVVGRP